MFSACAPAVVRPGPEAGPVRISLGAMPAALALGENACERKSLKGSERDGKVQDRARSEYQSLSAAAGLRMWLWL